MAAQMRTPGSGKSIDFTDDRDELDAAPEGDSKWDNGVELWQLAKSQDLRREMRSIGVPSATRRGHRTRLV